MMHTNKHINLLWCSHVIIHILYIYVMIDSYIYVMRYICTNTSYNTHTYVYVMRYICTNTSYNTHTYKHKKYTQIQAHISYEA